MSELKTNNITKLELNSNNITNIEVLAKFTNLKTLIIYKNNIEDITPIQNLTSLTSINLSDNNVKDILPLSNLSNLTHLNLQKNSEIDGNIVNYTGEKLVQLNRIGNILDRGGNIYLDADKIGLFKNYKKISLEDQNLETLDILEGMTQLTELNVNSNKITLQDKKSQEILKSMTNLKILRIANNKLKDIKILNYLPNLNHLELSGNDVNLKDIEDIISNLSVFKVSDDILATIVDCDPTKITKLRIEQANLTKLPDLSKLTNLKELNIYYTVNIEDYSVIEKISTLEKLNIYSVNLHGKFKDFSKLKNLKEISLSSDVLWSEDLEIFKVYKGITGLNIDLGNNSIIDASALLVLDSSTKIKLQGNINLSEESKQALKERFGGNVTL